MANPEMPAEDRAEDLVVGQTGEQAGIKANPRRTFRSEQNSQDVLAGQQPDAPGDDGEDAQDDVSHGGTVWLRR